MKQIIAAIVTMAFLLPQSSFSQNPRVTTFGTNTLSGKVIKEDLIDPSNDRIIKGAIVLKLPGKVEFKPKYDMDGDVTTDEIRIYGDLSKTNDYTFLVGKYVTISANIEFAPSPHYPLDANIISDFTYRITGTVPNGFNDPTVKLHNFFVDEGCKILSYCAHPDLTLDWFDCTVDEDEVVIDLYYGNGLKSEFRITRGLSFPLTNLAVNADNTGTTPFEVVKPIIELVVAYAESDDNKNTVEDALEKIFDKATESWTGADWTLCILMICYQFGG